MAIPTFKQCTSLYKNKLQSHATYFALTGWTTFRWFATDERIVDMLE